MNYLDRSFPPPREERLKACNAFGGSACSLVKNGKKGCLDNTGRGFFQTSSCQLNLALLIANTFSDTIVIIHGPVGCGGGTISQSGVIRMNQAARGDANPKGAIWFSTNLSEAEVINGGEQKLRETIIEADVRFRPDSIFVVGSCVPAIIGDDIENVVNDLRNSVSAKLLTMHCEGFKTKIQATAYDHVYHAVLKNLFDLEEEDRPIFEDDFEVLKYEEKRKRTVNLLNVSSISRADELELVRLLKTLDLDANIYPCYSHPNNFIKASEAALSISVCPTHDDYFVGHLKELYGVPFVLGTIPIGTTNVAKWFLEVARFFNEEERAKKIIASEETILKEALKPIIEKFKGKTAFVCAGEFRAAATAILLEEDLGVKVLGVKSFHYDFFAEEIFNSIPRGEEVPIDVGAWQPFEQANLLRRTKPDFYLGHNGGNGWAAKEGVPVLPIFNPVNNFMGYKGIFEFANRIERLLRNTSFNKNIQKYVKQPYKDSWFESDPYKYIKQDVIEKVT